MTEIYLLVAGSRGYTNYEFVKDHIDEFAATNIISKVISGGANGVDKLGERWAKDNNIDIDRNIPLWAKYGKRAGVIRNNEMIVACTHAIIFWNGVSPGTKITIDMLNKANKPHIIIKCT